MDVTSLWVASDVVDGDVVVEVLLSEEALPRYRLDWGAGSF